MALGIYFPHEGFTPELYHETIRRLAAAGQGSPSGRTFHCALESDGNIQVFDIWESREQFDTFGKVLVPILTELGVTLNDPMPANVENVIEA